MNKINRINAEIEKQVANIINQKLKDPRLQGGLISVTKAYTTADLKYSKIYLSFINIENTAEALNVINNASGFIRNELKTKMDIRVLPELTFYIDDSIEYGMKMDKILEEIRAKDDRQQ